MSDNIVRGHVQMISQNFCDFCNPSLLVTFTQLLLEVPLTNEAAWQLVYLPNYQWNISKRHNKTSRMSGRSALYKLTENYWYDCIGQRPVIVDARRRQTPSVYSIHFTGFLLLKLALKPLWLQIAGYGTGSFNLLRATLTLFCQPRLQEPNILLSQNYVGNIML